MRQTEPAWSRALPGWLVVALATLGPLGKKLPAPGTWGSLAGLLYFAACFQHSSIRVVLLGSVVACALAVVICGAAEHRLGKSDPGEVILDEFVVMPLCFLGWRELPGALPVWVVWLAGFALFRLFDIAKPLGIARLQSLPGGWGVVADDVAAALAACATLHAGAWAWAWW
ncbi:MAG: phosphatidylglycerophosphatase A [Opitutaceae bacterium]|nr:phosphatidylglycerophosphatase A [Opitutaceae bacterium]